MAGTTQGPTPYQGMGKPTQMESQESDDGAPEQRMDTVRQERFAPGSTGAHDDGDDFVRRSIGRYYR